MSSDSLGGHIRRNIMPPGLTVSEAARRMGVGRPALSNLLNGKATLSIEMAGKLAKTFGADADVLLRMQAQLMAAASAMAAAAVVAAKHAAGYLKITGTEIDAWADQVDARAALPVLIRRLIHESTPQLTQINFPGYDDGQRHGWDGQVEAEVASPWVPEGVSGWELSCSADLPGKPNSDFRARSDFKEYERKAKAFIFVTARRWPNKDQWADDQKDRSDWRDVRAYDASTIEQWLERSPATQIWFAEQLKRPADGVASLDQAWAEWANATDPILSPVLFDNVVGQHRQALWKWLADPAGKPFVVAADSQAEALAFLSLALREEDGSAGAHYASSIVISTPEAMRRVAAAVRGEIMIVTTPETERAASAMFANNRMIVLRPRSSIENDPDIGLGPVDEEQFEKALKDMNLESERIDQLRLESGHSATILRRRLALAPELKSPAWARDSGLVRNLVPLLLAGAWNSKVDADRSVLERMSGLPYAEVEVNLATLLTIADSPVWSIGNYHGIVSRKDALFAARGAITPDSLDRFFDLAQHVLGEDDPALDLSPEDRWTANIRGKSRELSGALREGVGEFLVLLSVYGDQLFKERLQFVPDRVDALVASLLSDSGERAWLAQRHDLPTLAEASPDAFLDAVERDLASENPKLIAMLRPVGSAVFDSPDRSGLLWGLERLAWDRDLVWRAARILTRLSEVPINDNWSNKPENSLGSLVRSWLPQTSAPIDERIKLLEAIVTQSSEVGWRLCLSQVQPFPRFATPNARPRWRGTAAIRRVTRGEDHQMRRKALDLLLAWPRHDEAKLGDLIALVGHVTEADEARIWDVCGLWLDAEPGDHERAALRERIRRHVRLRSRRGKSMTDALRRAQAFVDKLTPADLVTRHRWLFAEHYVHEDAGELTEEDFDFKKRDERIMALRTRAVHEIVAAEGFAGVYALLGSGNAWSAVGFHLTQVVNDPAERLALVCEMLSQSAADRQIDGALGGFLHALGDEREPFIRSFLVAEPRLNDADVLRLFKAAPFTQASWTLLAELRPELEEAYWETIEPGWAHEDGDLNFMVGRLLRAKRSRAAFAAVSHRFEKLDIDILARLMRGLVEHAGMEKGDYRFDQYCLNEAFAALHKRKGLPVAEMAQLEYLFVEALDDGEHGIPNLSLRIAESPADFVQLVGLVYKRSDDGIDPPELMLAEDADRQAVGRCAYRSLSAVNRIPGTDGNGKIELGKLLDWVSEVRAGLEQIARLDPGESQIGTLLAKSPPGSDGIWPHEVVRQALEVVGTERIASGMEIALYNSRGAVWRGAGGDQERELASKYAASAKQLRADYPFTARMLSEIADKYIREAKWHDTDDAVRKRLGR